MARAEALARAWLARIGRWQAFAPQRPSVHASLAAPVSDPRNPREGPARGTAGGGRGRAKGTYTRASDRDAGAAEGSQVFHRPQNRSSFQSKTANFGANHLIYLSLMC